MQQITDVKTAGEVLEQDSPAFDGKRYFEEDEETKKWNRRPGTVTPENVENRVYISTSSISDCEI